jgi:hypothetical protein
MNVKRNSLKQQRISAELETIIEEFGRAMRNANKEYIATPLGCHHERLRFTPRMYCVWSMYTNFCVRNLGV